MNDGELKKNTIEEFVRVQRWMLLSEDRESALYQAMYERYLTLKAILSDLGTNTAELDRIRE